MLSIIIPTLEEEGMLSGLFAALDRLASTTEVIVVDGRSGDRTLSIAAERVGHFRRGLVLESRPGRGTQLAAGADAATGDLFLFLHADSRPSPPMIDRLLALSAASRTEQRNHGVALFRLGFDDPHVILRLYALFARIESYWTSFGDQGVLVGADMYRHIGPIPAIPILEDVGFLKQARAVGTITKYPERITTSSRRFLVGGVIRTQLENGRILLRHRRGTDSAVIAEEYRSQ